MTTNLRAGLLSAAGLLVLASTTHAQSAVGFWLTTDGQAVVHIEDCGASGLCGYLVGLRPRCEGDVGRDIKNPDETKRDVPLCGLMILGSLKPSSDTPGKWEDGWAYDPDSGNTYSGQMQLEGPDTLKLRGYVGIPLLGRSETWARETVANNRCTPPAGN